MSTVRRSAAGRNTKADDAVTGVASKRRKVQGMAAINKTAVSETDESETAEKTESEYAEELATPPVRINNPKKQKAPTTTISAKATKAAAISAKTAASAKAKDSRAPATAAAAATKAMLQQKEQLLTSPSNTIVSNKPIVPTVGSDGAGKPLNYMQRANPPGKKRDVGGEKRNRKEQMTIEEQIQASRDVAEALEARVIADHRANAETKAFLLPRKQPTATSSATHLVGLTATGLTATGWTANEPGFAAAAAAVASTNNRFAAKTTAADDRVLEASVVIGRSSVPKQCGEVSASHPLIQRIMAEKWAHNSAAENGGVPDSLPAPGSAIVKTTRSVDLKPRDYAAAYERRKYKDTTYDEEARKAQEAEFISACNSLAGSVIKSSSAAGALLAAAAGSAEAVYRRSGYGESVITMEDFSVLAESSDGKQCAYPMRSKLRCRYDHHQFDSIPVLLPLRWHAAKRLLSVNSRMVFCSFSCALAFIEREMPHDIARSERRALLEFVARTFFAVDEPLRPAPFLEQHVDYGGTLSTAQFRALGITHCSFIEQPIACVAVPCKITTQIVMHKKVDRAKRQALNLRTREEHMSAVPDEPIDPAARVDNATARGADGKKRKERVAPDEHGKRIAVDREHLDAKIFANAKLKAAQQPTVKHSLGNLVSETNATSPSQSSTIETQAALPKAKKAKTAAANGARSKAATAGGVKQQGITSFFKEM